MACDGNPTGADLVPQPQRSTLWRTKSEHTWAADRLTPARGASPPQAKRSMPDHERTKGTTVAVMRSGSSPALLWERTASTGGIRPLAQGRSKS